MKKRWILLICIVLLVIISLSVVLAVLLRANSVEAQQSVGCVPRNFGHDSFVCVCNVTYCDSFINVAPGGPGVVTTYQSDRDLNRFAVGQLQFSKNTLDVGDGIVITIERDQKFQTLFGFGGSFSDSAGLNIDKLPAKLGKNIIKDYYGNNGLKYSMGRVPIGGSDFSTRAYTYDDSDVEDFDLANWKLQAEDIQYKIPYIQQALNEATVEIKLVASPWSPPAWMKTNNQLNGKGELKGNPTGIYYKTWADYFVKFLDTYKQHDIQFWGITVQNEPLDGTIENFAFNALGMTAAQQRDFVFKTLGPKLNSSGYGKDKLQLMIMDDQRTLIKHWADTILSQEEAKQFVSGIAYHWYMNPFSPPELLDEIHEKYPDFFLVSSEACIGSSPFDRNQVEMGSWTRAESYAYDIIHDLQHHTTSWLDWNLALDTTGGPNWVQNKVDSPILINATAQEYYKNPMYYALGHFTRFLEPGSVRLGITQNKESLEVTVFSTPSKSTVAVVLNRYQSQIPLQINDPKYGAIRTTMDAHSIKTFVWFD